MNYRDETEQRLTVAREAFGGQSLLGFNKEILGITTPAGAAGLKVMLKNAVLLDLKQQDYGPLNIAMHGEVGLTVRMTDKVMRLNNLIQRGSRRKPKNEGLLDTYRDIANYAVIAELVRTGQWM